MDNPEIKALLKSAKEALKAKDFKEAMKLCRVCWFNINSLYGPSPFKICNIFLFQSQPLRRTKKTTWPGWWQERLLTSKIYQPKRSPLISGPFKFLRIKLQHGRFKFDHWSLLNRKTQFNPNKMCMYLQQGLAQLYEKGNNYSDLGSVYYELRKIFKGYISWVFIF